MKILLWKDNQVRVVDHLWRKDQSQARESCVDAHAFLAIIAAIDFLSHRKSIKITASFLSRPIDPTTVARQTTNEIKVAI